METNCTEGEWIVETESNNELWVIPKDSNVPIAKINGVDYSYARVVQSEETIANAKVISASKDLLIAALKYQWWCIENNTEMGFGFKAAIKKATE